MTNDEERAMVKAHAERGREALEDDLRERFGSEYRRAHGRLLRESLRLRARGDAGAMTLGALLEAIVKHDTDYETRNGLVIQAVTKAVTLGYPAGYRIDPKEPEWPVAFIGLPTGQVSWHVPQYPDAWDGHTTEEKHQRIAAYCAGVPGHEGQMP